MYSALGRGVVYLVQLLFVCWVVGGPAWAVATLSKPLTQMKDERGSIHNVAVVACQRHGIAHPPPPRVAVLLARHFLNSANGDARCSKVAVQDGASIMI